MSEEVRNVKRKKINRKARRFWKAYGVVAAVLLVVVVILNILVWNIMVEYQNSQPSTVLGSLMEKVVSGKENLSNYESKFESVDEQVKKDFIESIKGKELTYVLDSASKEKTAPIYDILLEDKTVAKATLHSKSSKTKLLMLVIEDWEVTGLMPVYQGDYTVTLTVPKNYSASLNGVMLGETEQVKNTNEKFMSYYVTGLFHTPTLEVMDENGNQVAIPASTGKDDMHLTYEVGMGDITTIVTVPDSYQVLVNGNLMDTSNQTGETTVISALEDAASYVQTPNFVSYKVTGLASAPTVEIQDGNGNAVALPEDSEANNEKRYVYEVGYAPQESIPEEIYNMALDNYERYVLFLKRDLEGESLDLISYMFPADSFYLEMAKRYREEGDMSFTSYHTYPTFEDIAVTDYTVYNENLFTIRVRFTESMYLIHGNGETDTEPTLEVNDQIFQYVKIDGNWVIAGMRSAI